MAEMTAGMRVRLDTSGIVLVRVRDKWVPVSPAERAGNPWSPSPEDCERVAATLRATIAEAVAAAVAAERERVRKDCVCNCHNPDAREAMDMQEHGNCGLCAAAIAKEEEPKP